MILLSFSINWKTLLLKTATIKKNVIPKKEYFPKRNRIIAALCNGLIVIEAKKRSGTMITVNEALNLGIDIMCVPTRADEDSGCNYLIKNGAYLIETSQDVIDIIG